MDKAPGVTSAGADTGSTGVRLDVSRGIAHICFDRPPVNAFTLDMIDKLRSTMEQLSGHPRPILLTGANGFFSAGFDTRQPDLDGSTPRTAARECLAAIRDYPGPVVAAVEGAAVGLGLLIAASADILVVSRSARLRMPEINLGIISDFEPLRRLLPEMWVRRMCLLGEVATAADIQLDAVGAILCEPGDTEQAAARVLESLVTIEPTALTGTKRRLAG